MGHTEYSSLVYCADRCAVSGIRPFLAMSVCNPYTYYKSLYLYGLVGEATQLKINPRPRRLLTTMFADNFSDFLRSNVVRNHFTQIHTVRQQTGDIGRVDFFVRTEHMQDDLNNITHSLGLPFVRVEFHNPTPIETTEVTSLKFGFQEIDFINQAEADIFDAGLEYTRRSLPFEIPLDGSSSLLHDGVLAHMFECPEFGWNLKWTYDTVTNTSLARSLLRDCMLKYLQMAERPSTYVSTTTSLQTFMDRNVGVFLPASKAGCTYIRDGSTLKTMNDCSVSDDVFLKYSREVGETLERDYSHDNVRKYWMSNRSIRCCLALPRAIRLRSKLTPTRWLNHNQVQIRFALNESIGLFCRLNSNCDMWASLVSDVFLNLTGRALPVEWF